MMLMLMRVPEMVYHLKYKTKVVGETPERPPQSGNPGDAD